MIVPLVVGAAIAASPPAVFVDRPAASVGEVVTFHVRVRTPLRLYLAPAGANVRSRFDARLRYLGTLRRGRGSFAVPAVNAGRYRLWCSGCARRRVAFRVTWRDGCPTTGAVGEVFGNDALSTGHYDAPQRADDGRYFWKMYWFAAAGLDGVFTLSASRLDDRRSRADIGAIHRGSDQPTASWASVLSFPSAGCWRITARLDEVTLIRVVMIR